MTSPRGGLLHRHKLLVLRGTAFPLKEMPINLLLWDLKTVRLAKAKDVTGVLRYCCGNCLEYHLSGIVLMKRMELTMFL